jgi:hypothetical protein
MHAWFGSPIRRSSIFYLYFLFCTFVSRMHFKNTWKQTRKIQKINKKHQHAFFMRLLKLTTFSRLNERRHLLHIYIHFCPGSLNYPHMHVIINWICFSLFTPKYSTVHLGVYIYRVQLAAGFGRAYSNIYAALGDACIYICVPTKVVGGAVAASNRLTHHHQQFSTMRAAPYPPLTPASSAWHASWWYIAAVAPRIL